MTINEYASLRQHVFFLEQGVIELENVKKVILASFRKQTAMVKSAAVRFALAIDLNELDLEFECLVRNIDHVRRLFLQQHCRRQLGTRWGNVSTALDTAVSFARITRSVRHGAQNLSSASNAFVRLTGLILWCVFAEHLS